MVKQLLPLVKGDVIGSNPIVNKCLLSSMVEHDNYTVLNISAII